MPIDTGYIIIWGDAHIGLEENCRKMKEDFQVGLLEAAAVPPLPPDPINDLICAVQEYSAPVEFAQNDEEALNLIENNLAFSKKIIFISSATMARSILPQIQEKEFQIESYYIFCGNMALHRDWAMDWINEGLEIQMFDHQITLLTRLGRDMSNILIEDGKTLLKQNKPETALTYFQFAYALADKAVEYDKPVDSSDTHRPSTAYRRILDDLIEKAKQAM